MKLILIDKVGLRYAGKRVRKGQPFDASRQDARALIALGKACRAPEPEAISGKPQSRISVTIEGGIISEGAAQVIADAIKDAVETDAPPAKAVDTQGDGAADEPAAPPAMKAEPARARARRRDVKAPE